jgi:NAD(P)-dependent dehydrogenase (short-subunit alcohol dehydrogenase family)
MQTVLITGANRGIGLSLSRHFLKAGWHVIATCRKPDSAAALTALACPQLQVLQLDVTDARSVLALVAALDGRALDVLINNAGIMGPAQQGVHDMDYDGFLQTLSVNAVAPLRVSAALLPNLKLTKRPRIVTVSSQMGAFDLDMGPGHIAYSSSKSAVSKVMQLMAKELAAEGIIACPVHPGWVKTDMGGPNAQLDPADCAAGLYKLIDGLQLQHSGRFWTWEGNEHAW